MLLSATTLKQSADLWKDKEKWFEASCIFIIESMFVLDINFTSPC